jgi:hypothetical protein
MLAWRMERLPVSTITAPGARRKTRLSRRTKGSGRDGSAVSVPIWPLAGRLRVICASAGAARAAVVASSATTRSHARRRAGRTQGRPGAAG